MQKIEIAFKNGNGRIFINEPTFGDERLLKIEYKENFVVITNSFKNQHVFFGGDIEEIVLHAKR